MILDFLDLRLVPLLVRSLDANQLRRGINAENRMLVNHRVEVEGSIRADQLLGLQNGSGQHLAEFVPGDSLLRSGDRRILEWDEAVSGQKITDGSWHQG